MNLTKNEKRTLKILLENSRVSDTEIASKLKITKQAVGKIKRKLETSGVIRGYSLDIDYGRLGLHTFAFILAKLKPEGWEKFGEVGLEPFIQNTSNIITAYRIPEGNATHILLYGFRDLIDLDAYFSSNSHCSDFKKYFDISNIYIFSYHSLIKNNSPELLSAILENNNKKFKSSDEIAIFKKKLASLDAEKTTFS